MYNERVIRKNSKKIITSIIASSPFISNGNTVSSCADTLDTYSKSFINSVKMITLENKISYLEIVTLDKATLALKTIKCFVGDNAKILQHVLKTRDEAAAAIISAQAYRAAA